MMAGEKMLRRGLVASVGLFLVAAAASYWRV
jgi:hypothetical protein